MCLMVMALRVHRKYPLIMAANRDEFDARPSSSAHFWPEAPWVLAGRDERGGGTWMGVSSRGRLALVTNVREPGSISVAAPSRGELAADYLLEKESEGAFRSRLYKNASAYNGFNLVFGTGTELSWFSNAGDGTDRIPSGIHGVSNALLNTPWPKVIRAKAGLWSLLHSGRTPQASELFGLLADTTPFPDRELPHTGVGLDKERLLAPICVHAPGYGTQVSTVLYVHKSGGIDFWERDVRAACGCCRADWQVRRFRINGSAI